MHFIAAAADDDADNRDYNNNNDDTCDNDDYENQQALRREAIYSAAKETKEEVKTICAETNGLFTKQFMVKPIDYLKNTLWVYQ